ncbi:MAG: hypothetical protein J5818_04205 [Eggerthellaceae bacterium]|nr:hypothetical protein [Eggerthellaceae bacterium]
MNLEDYIKDLAPELQEKVRACGSIEELLALAKENAIPMPDEALAAIAGGADAEVGNCKPKMPNCPKCGSPDVKYEWLDYEFICQKCGYRWI